MTAETAVARSTTKPKDIFERAVWTYVQSLVMLLLASPIFDVDATNRTTVLVAALVSALPAGLTVIWTWLRLIAGIEPSSYWGDLLLRIGATFAATFLGYFLASDVFDVGHGVSAVSVANQAWLAAGAASLALLKGWVARGVGDPGNASTEPPVGQPPMPGA